MKLIPKQNIDELDLRPSPGLLDLLDRRRALGVPEDKTMEQIRSAYRDGRLRSHTKSIKAFVVDFSGEPTELWVKAYSDYLRITLPNERVE